MKDKLPIEAQVQPLGNVDQMLQELADRMGAKANVSAVYGKPIERDGVTVIPVAKAIWGVGGGGGVGTADGFQAMPDGEATGAQEAMTGDTAEKGAKNAGSGAGMGAGGGMRITPVGFIEIRGGEVAYRPIRDPLAYAPLFLIGGLTAWLMLVSSRLLRRA